jgi:hypothetical protein
MYLPILEGRPAGGGDLPAVDDFDKYSTYSCAEQVFGGITDKFFQLVAAAAPDFFQRHDELSKGFRSQQFAGVPEEWLGEFVGT